MLIPPEELREYVHVEPNKGLVISDDAPDDVRESFARWLAEIEEFTAAGFDI